MGHRDSLRFALKLICLLVFAWLHVITSGVPDVKNVNVFVFDKIEDSVLAKNELANLFREELILRGKRTTKRIVFQRQNGGLNIKTPKCGFL